VREGTDWDGSYIVTVFPNREVALSQRGIDIALYSLHIDHCPERARR